MNKDLSAVLVVESVIGLATVATLYSLEKTNPSCSGMGCLLSISHFSYFFAIIITIIILLVTIFVYNIGEIVRKKPTEKKSYLPNVIIILMIIALFVYFYLRTKI